nr:hypothetical protein [Nocardia tenerifensis]
MGEDVGQQTAEYANSVAGEYRLGVELNGREKRSAQTVYLARDVPADLHRPDAGRKHLVSGAAQRETVVEPDAFAVTEQIDLLLYPLIGHLSPRQPQSESMTDDLMAQAYGQKGPTVGQ